MSYWQTQGSFNLSIISLPRVSSRRDSEGVKKESGGLRHYFINKRKDQVSSHHFFIIIISLVPYSCHYTMGRIPINLKFSPVSSDVSVCTHYDSSVSPLPG